ncbi:MAG: hypothetical protein A2W23_00310 [Planctomycetes bacterium RBG_16_43_13]|nr:MAG: hypothetical protein A2W23_00310 [Planctomycetes bacterium RBG_16_43_13]
MSFSTDAITDVAAFLDEFGEAAIFNSTSSVTVIFDNPSQPILDAETGGIMMVGPQAVCKTSDVPDAKGKTLKINDVTYNIIEARADGTGMTTLTLSKD